VNSIKEKRNYDVILSTTTKAQIGAESWPTDDKKRWFTRIGDKIFSCRRDMNMGIVVGDDDFNLLKTKREVIAKVRRECRTFSKKILRDLVKFMHLGLIIIPHMKFCYVHPQH